MIIKNDLHANISANASMPVATSSLSNVHPPDFLADQVEPEPTERTALLDSICNFKKSALKKID